MNRFGTAHEFPFTYELAFTKGDVFAPLLVITTHNGYSEHLLFAYILTPLIMFFLSG
jgi:hypothetical protein